jgi:hypothetical protein
LAKPNYSFQKRQKELEKKKKKEEKKQRKHEKKQTNQEEEKDTIFPEKQKIHKTNPHPLISTTSSLTYHAKANPPVALLMT